MSNTVNEILLNESRAEIGRLRTENFGLKRLEEERKAQTQALTAERDQLRYQCQQLEAQVSACHAQIQQLQGVEQQLGQLQTAQHRLQQDYELSLRARRILEEELADERKQRKQVEEAKAVLDSERSRHQRAKDDLAMSLRVARKKAEEAEEEQVRAEQEAAELRQELSALQSGGGEAMGRGALERRGEEGSYSTLHAKRHATPGSAEVAAEEAMRAAEYERCRAEAMSSRLLAAEEEVAALSQGVQLVEELKVELHSTRRALHQMQAEQFQQQQHPSSSASQQQPHHPQTAAQSENTQSENTQGAVPGSHDSDESHVSALPPLYQAELAVLQAKVTKLKASRDKLLEQIDKQWEELDRVGLEAKAAQDELASMRRLAANWEAQAQDSLAHVDRLKEMLYEASSWGSSSGPPPALPEHLTAAQTGSTNQGENTPDTQAAAGAALLQEKAHSAEMELHARALAAELLRAQHASLSIGKAVLPALSGIEHRLTVMLRNDQQTLRSD